MKQTKLEQSIEETIPGRLFIPRIEQRLLVEEQEGEDLCDGYEDSAGSEKEIDDPQEYDWREADRESSVELNKKKGVLYKLLEDVNI